MFRSSDISPVVNGLFGGIVSLTLSAFCLGFLMLKEVPISPRLPIQSHYLIAQATCKLSSWSPHHHHTLIFTLPVSLALLCSLKQHFISLKFSF